MLARSPPACQGSTVAAPQGQDPRVWEAMRLLQHPMGLSMQVGRKRSSLAGFVVCFGLVMMQWYHFHAKC